MDNCNHSTHERALTVEDDITVEFHKVDSHGISGGDHDERTAERIHLRGGRRASWECDDGGDDARETGREESGGCGRSPEDDERGTLCPPTFCVRSKPTSREESAREGRGAHALKKMKGVG